MDIRIRPTRETDLDFVTTLERKPENQEMIGQWTDEEHLDAIAGRDGREHWIVEHDGQPAGYLIAFDGREHRAGFYVKRILIADKERGTGTAALASFLHDACARPGVDFVWLMVRDHNLRAQAVYRKLGFERYDPDAEELARWNAKVDAGGEGVFRMRIDSTDWPKPRAR